MLRDGGKFVTAAVGPKSRGEGIVGYNAQIAVDTTNHLIVAVDVTNVGNDRSQLYPVAIQAREAVDTETLSVIADRGYFNGNQVQARGYANHKASPHWIYPG